MTTLDRSSSAGVGFLVTGRHPGNPIGWLLLGAGVSSGINGFLVFAQSAPASKMWWR